ncbi:unnamed protein product, partial [Didymodactylos carnosus]
MGIAEVPTGAVSPKRGHTHDAEEVYYFLSGKGTVNVDGVETDVGPGTSVWIPANAEHFCHNTGAEPLKLLQELSSYDWTNLLNQQPDVSTKVSAWTKKILKIADKIIPNKLVTVSSKDASWFNSELQAMLKRRDILYKKYSQPLHPSPHAYQAYLNSAKQFEEACNTTKK